MTLPCKHYSDVIMSTMASQITGVSIVCSTVGSGTNQRKHQSSAWLAFVRGIHRWPVHFPHKRPVTRKMFPFYDVIMNSATTSNVERRPDIKQKITSISHTPGWAISCLCKYFWYKLTVFWWDLIVLFMLIWTWVGMWSAWTSVIWHLCG